MKKIEIKCKGNRYINHKELKHFQGNLKTLTKDRMEKLKKEIVKLGWIAPIFVWNKNEILDGHQRLFVLNEMFKEGYIIDNIPIVDIEAENKTEAAKILLALNSRYGQITDEGLYEFMNLTGLSEKDLEEIELPDLDIDRFIEGYYQNKIIDEDFNENKEWQGMPEFKNEPKAFKTIHIHFEKQEYIEDFEKKIGWKINEKSISFWYPPKEKRNLKDLYFKNET